VKLLTALFKRLCFIGARGKMNKQYETHAELFEDEKRFGAVIASFLIYGILSFLLVFLLGWLAFDYFWTSLLVGLGSLLFFLIKMVRLSMEKNEYEEFIKDNAKDGAKEMGISIDKAEGMMKSATKIFEKASKNAD
jgi:hypothetical protein